MTICSSIAKEGIPPVTSACPVFATPSEWTGGCGDCMDVRVANLVHGPQAVVHVELVPDVNHVARCEVISRRRLERVPFAASRQICIPAMMSCQETRHGLGKDQQHVGTTNYSPC